MTHPIHFGRRAAAIVLVSKWAGHRFLQRDEDYYDR